MTNEELESTRSAEEKLRELLWRRMYSAIVHEFGGLEGKLFRGQGARLTILGAIADLTKLLLVETADVTGDCNWREMVSEVHREMLKWLEV